MKHKNLEMYLFLPELVEVVVLVVVLVVVVVVLVVEVVGLVGATGCDNVIVFPLTVMAKLKDILLHLIM